MNHNKLDNNCGKCYWSARNPTDLLLTCTLGKIINNEWVTAHKCNCYCEIHSTRKKIPNKQITNNTNQLELF